mmetsp:Transcript_509/g.763  ORF Transcript_509/g.763 Transcript_509/m.763 type:complete len:258 (+) Transcript_509:88-861(+)
MNESRKRQKKNRRYSVDPANLLKEQDDVTMVIMSFLNFPTLIRIQRVSTYWKVLVCRAMPGRLGSKMFMTKEELAERIGQYCNDKIKYADDIASTYGWPIGKWNVSQITDFTFAFYIKHKFNEDISGWDMSNATNLSYMFHWASSFNQDLSKWNTSKVIHMSSMFDHAISFNGDVTKWDTSEARNMSSMFEGAAAFNQNVWSWNTSQVRYMERMFHHAESFNQDVSVWDLSNLFTIPRLMFDGAKSFNHDRFSPNNN